MKASMAVLVLALAGCPQTQPIPTPPEGPATCKTACDVQGILKCPLAQSTPEGSSCVEVCENTQDGPEFLAWDVKCLTHATACSQCR